MSKYDAMGTDEALRYLKARDAGDEPVLAEFTRAAGSGDAADGAPLVQLENELRALKKKFPASLREKDQKGGEFERQACEIVHRCLAKYEPLALADHDFWTWLAVAKFADLIEWRFGAKGKHAKAANYGIGTRGENLLFRLWLRAEIGREGAGHNAYALAKTGDQDLWRSHILRQGYANARHVARALLKLQAGKLRSKRLSVESIRELAKRLRRLRANVIFEYLTPSQTDNLVLELCADLKKGK